MKFLKRAGVLFLALAVFVFCAFWHGLVVRRYEVPSGKITGTLRIALLADLHNTIYGNDQDELIAKIKAEKPDIIALCGDIGDDVIPNEGARLLVSGLQGVAPMFYVTGNHEFWGGQVDAFADMLESYGVRVLSDGFEALTVGENTINVAGINDPEGEGVKSRDELSGIFDAMDKSRFCLLLAHRPERFADYAGYGFDLALSGHAHGGQVRIPFLLNGLWAPDQGRFPKHAGGLYWHGEMAHVVSRGLSYNPKLPRVFNPPELCMVTVRGIY